MALFGSYFVSLLTQNRWLGDDSLHANSAGVCCIMNGAYPEKSTCRLDRLLKSWQPTRRRYLHCSMRCKEIQWADAVTERFILSLKMTRIRHKEYTNRAEATSDDTDYIMTFYKSVQLHSTLGNLSSNVMNKKLALIDT